MKTFNDRLLEYLSHKEITKYRFYKDTGLANGSLDKKSSPSVERCEKICSVYADVRVEWLIMGTGDMLRSCKKEDKPENKTNYSPSIDKTTVAYFMDEIKALSEENGKLKSEIEQLKSKGYTIVKGAGDAAAG